MEELLAELAEPLALVVYALVAATLTVLGLLMELSGLSGVSNGLSVHTAWTIYVGLVALAAGVTVGRRKLIPALRAE